MSDAVRCINELRIDLMEAEIRKRWALADLDVDGFLAVCAEIKSIQNALFNLEARMLSQEKKNELLPPRTTPRADGTDGQVRH